MIYCQYMKNNTILWRSLGHAVLVFAYTSLVAGLLFQAENIFDNDDTFLIPVGMLLLFVLSATIVGSLVLGRPILMYLEGQKKEAIKFLGGTLLWLFVLVVIIFTVLAIR